MLELLLGKAKPPQVFHHGVGLKMSLKNRTHAKNTVLTRMIYNSRTSFVLEKISVDENPNKGTQINPPEVPGSGINRDHRLMQVRRQHPQSSPGETFLVPFPGTADSKAAFSHTMK